MINIKRVYEKFDSADGYRVLVDRVWPRGISKEEAKVDLWLQEIAPTTVLRKWFNHDVQKWVEFKSKYKQELKEKEELVGQLRQLAKKHKTVTILYGAKDTEHNQAVVLLELIK